MLHCASFRSQNESNNSDSEPGEDEREGARDGAGGHQQVLAPGVQGLRLDLPRRVALRDDGGRRHLYVLPVRGAGKWIS